MKIVVLDGFAANPGDLPWSALKALGECTVYDRTKPEEVVDRCKDADAVLTNKVAFNRDKIEALPQLKYIGVLATGFNIIDIKAAAERNIVVTNIPAYSTHSVAQMVFAHILNIAQRVGMHEIRIAVSDGITLSMASFLGMGLSDWVTGTKRSEIQSTGVYGIGYRYAINRFKVGADVGFINITSELKYANEKTPSLKEKSRDILVLPTGEFIYYKRGVISLYGSASAGIDFSWDSFQALRTILKPVGNATSVTDILKARCIISVATILLPFVLKYRN